MNSAELIITVANVTGLPRKDVREVLETASDVVAETLHSGTDEVITFPGLGKFRPVLRQSRRVILPSGAEAVVDARTSVKFAASGDFRKRLNGDL